MELFRNKKAKKTACDCGGCCDVTTKTVAKLQAAYDGTLVRVLGSGCKKCNELTANAKAALEQLGMDTTIDHVTDFAQIAAYGVMSTPALMVDGKVVSYGKVLKTDEVVKLLQKAQGRLCHS